MLYKRISYTVAHVGKAYMEKTFQVTGCPTHLAINKSGSIVKVMNTEKEPASVLLTGAMK